MKQEAAVFLAAGFFLLNSSVQAKIKFAPAACEPQVRGFLQQETLDSGGVVAQIRTESEGLVQSYPAKTFGTWFEKHMYADGHVEVWKVSEKSQTIYRWNDSNCEINKTSSSTPTKDFVFRDSAVVPSVTDKEAAAFISKNPRGLIYLWSPKMPLSVTGLEAVAAVAKTNHLPAMFLVDPSLGDSDYTEMKHHVPASAWARNMSFGLNYVGMQMHYPSLFFFSGGKLNPSPAMGFRGVQGYEKLIAEWLEPEAQHHRGIAVAPKEGVPADDDANPATQMATPMTVKLLKTTYLPQAFGFFVKPVWGTRWIGVHHDWSTSYFFNLDTGALVDLGITNDVYVSPTDHLYATYWATKGKDGGGKLGLAETAEFMKLTENSHYTPKDMLIDDTIKADYQCVGTLDGGGAKDVGQYRVLTGGYKNHLTYRDYEITPRKGTRPASVRPLSDTGVLCSSIVGDKDFATPMLSKDGRFVAATVGRGKNSSHIYKIGDKPEECDDLVTFATGTSKVSFSFDNNLIAFAQRGQAYVFNREQNKLYKLNGIEEVVGTGQLHFPEFREDGTLLAPMVMKDGSMAVVEFSLP